MPQVVIGILNSRAAEPQGSAPAPEVQAAGLLLVLFYLTRSRVPEALHAFALHRPRGERHAEGGRSCLLRANACSAPSRPLGAVLGLWHPGPAPSLHYTASAALC